MVNSLVDSRDVRFVLFEMLEADKLVKYPGFSDLDKDVFEDTLNLAEKMAVEYFYPSNSAGDKEGGAKFDPATNEVKVPESVKTAWNAYINAGFLKMRIDAQGGGMGLPDVVTAACDEYFQAANTSLWIYGGLTLGAATLIKEFGTDEQKRLFVGKMLSGEWGGTMCLTEPEAGSDVGNIKTKAVRQNDGTYLIKGRKIFISAGEHDLTDNIVHTVLARIEGDPRGTKGISVFIVPKFLANPDGSKGARNDVVCTGIEHKMGIKSSSTAGLNFGDNGKCTGYLLGEEKKGMKLMFHLMNLARVETGLQALAQSSAAYMHAVTYAKNRKQGAHIAQIMNPDAPMVAIIEHPDVQRMLLWMKSHVEGMRMLAYYISECMDISHAGTGEEARKAAAIIELLTPVNKAGISEASWLITSEAMQVFGGYGYCSDYPVEQFARDTKIFSIYEGTTGIQALDLVFRKILLNKGQYNYKIWRKRVKKTISDANGIVGRKYIKLVKRGLKKSDKALDLLTHRKDIGFLLFMLWNKALRRRPDIDPEFFISAAANATPFLQSFFMMALAWLHLWSLTIAVPKLKQLIGNAGDEEKQNIINNNNEAAYYYGKVLSSQYYINAEFPKYFGRIDSILRKEDAAVKACPAAFTGAPD